MRGATLVFTLMCALALCWRSLGWGTAPLVRRRLQTVDFGDTTNRFAVPKPVTLAFFLQISGSTTPHLPRLLRKIWEPVNLYAIHIDAKVPVEERKALQQGLLKENSLYGSNVHFMEPELITYRGVSMLLNTINGMQLLLERGTDWDFFINLSGSDYPLITPTRQREILGSASRAHNYIALAPQRKWAQNSEYRYRHFYVDEALTFTTGETRVVQIDHSNPVAEKTEFVYSNAEAWMINSRQFCEYVTKSAAARKLLATFAFSVESSEHYFATLAYNSRFNGTLVHSSLRDVLWFHKGRAAGQHPFYVDERQRDGTYTFREKVHTSPKFYIRKFKNADSPLMDQIDERMEEGGHLSKVRKYHKWLIGVAGTRAAEQPGSMPFD